MKTSALLVPLALLVLLACGCRQNYRVTTESMSPTLEPGDLVSARPFDPTHDVLGRFDLIAIGPALYGGKVVYVKRVIGLPGDVVNIGTNALSINGHVLPEAALPEPLRGKTWIPEGLGNRIGQPVLTCQLATNEVYVVSDNLDIVNDSRNWGVVLMPFENSRDHLEGGFACPRLILDQAWPTSDRLPYGTWTGPSPFARS